MLDPIPDEILRLLDLLPIGVFLVRSDARVMAENECARRLLSNVDGLRLDGGRLRAARPDETASLHKHITRAVRGRARHAEALSLAHAPGRPPLAVLICSLDDSRSATREPLAALFASDPSYAPQLDRGRLRALYGLTPAEADLAVRIAEGRRLREAADSLGVSINTVRTHLRQLFLKTETKRQADLVRLLMSSPAVLRVR